VISFAQNFEDVMIARLFPADHRGFYIDIGAADPVYLSVTKHFYDAGWQGVNVEPLPRFFARLEAARPRDVNLNAIIGKPGERQRFFEIEELPENSTSDQRVMIQLQEQGRTVQTHEVEVIGLEELCERHAAGREIDFMKIDVEGGELEVLQSADWQRFRPVLLVIEAVVVNGREETWEQWEHVVTDHGYQKVWFDGLNNYYLRQESLDLRVHFRLPPNVFDGIQLANQQAVVDQLAAANADREAKQEVVDRLIADLTTANADREAKQEVVDRLISDLATANADREAKQHVIDQFAARLAALEAERK